MKQVVSQSLYSLTEEVEALMELVAENGGEITEEHEKALDQVQTLIQTKADSVCGWVESQQNLIHLANAKMAELSEFKRRVELRIERIDGYVNACMEKMGVQKIEGEMRTIKKRKPTKVVVVSDESLIPYSLGGFDFIKIPEPKPQLSKTELAKALKAGIEVPGATLEDSKNISISYGLK